ncbi:MAG: sigma-70 family RNA polymerase sigma factor [Pirellulales bacterium]
MWPTSDETQELLAGARDGDADAVNRLLERHREALRRMIDMRLDRKIRQRVDASDVVQDVLVDAHRRLKDYLSNPAMPFHLWLRQMAKDRLIDAHRRHRDAARRSLDREQPLAIAGTDDRSTIELAAQLWDREMTPAAAATVRELQQRFAAAVELLDEQDREVILMRHFEQLSNSEVAAALGLTAPAASMRYLRAMRRLRELLDVEQGDGDSSAQSV